MEDLYLPVETGQAASLEELLALAHTGIMQLAPEVSLEPMLFIFAPPAYLMLSLKDLQPEHRQMAIDSLCEAQGSQTYVIVGEAEGQAFMELHQYPNRYRQTCPLEGHLPQRRLGIWSALEAVAEGN